MKAGSGGSVGAPLAPPALLAEGQVTLADRAASGSVRRNPALFTIHFDESDVGQTRARIDLTGERYPIAC